MPRKNLILLIVIILAIALGVDRAVSAEKYDKDMATFLRIMNVVQDAYVEEVDSEKLLQGAYRGMLGTLDPYTVYLDQDQTTSFTADTEGQFGGLGIEIILRDGILTVLSPIRGTPAYDAGILAGDMVLKIDGESTEGITLEEAVSKLRGEIGSKVTLTVRHVGSIRNNDIEVTRAVIKPTAVEFEMVDTTAGIGLIRISSFTARVMQDLQDAVDDLQKQGLNALILDLRQNPGGLLDMSVKMADLFLSDGIIVSVKGRNEVVEKVYRAKKGDALENIPVVLVIDQGSASASEILAGALKDNHRAMLVGATTYGKGSVQNVVPLGNGDALKITVARYYRPNDQPILDHQGIHPDIDVPMTTEQLIALRAQEREDKLRGTYHLGSLLEEQLPPVDSTEEVAPPETPPMPPVDGGITPAAPRRERIADFQLKAALNILEWQLKHK